MAKLKIGNFLFICLFLNYVSNIWFSYKKNFLKNDETDFCKYNKNQHFWCSSACARRFTNYIFDC